MNNGDTMTPKQSAFASFVASGDSQAEAYRKAYDASGMADQVVRNEASALARKDKVKKAIVRLKEADKVEARGREMLTNDWVIEKLRDEAVNDRNPASTRVRALELLGKTGGLFDESTHITFEQRSPEEIEKELVEKLGMLWKVEA